MSILETETLGDVLTSFDQARRPIKSTERVPGSTPYLGASGIVDWVEGETHDGEFLCVSEDGENLRSRSTPIAWVQSGKFWANNHLHVFGGVSRSRLKYFEGAIATANVSSYLTGSAQPKLTQRAALAIEVPKVSADSQAAIGEVLGALDDKIAANRRMVGAADELVRVLYVELPKSSVTLSHVASNVRVPADPVELDANSLYVGLEHFDQRSMWLHRGGRASAVTSGKIAFCAGDTLFGKLRPYFHKVAVAPHQGVCSTDVLVLRAVNPVDGILVTAAAASDEVVQTAVQSSNGTKMPRAKWTDISNCLVPDPEAAETRRFVCLSEGLKDRALAALDENLRLSATRDELLPLLMSGKITVKDAEKTVEEVV